VVTVLLPIKANSQRIPGKNFKHLAGTPLFHWILDALLAVDVVQRIVINTDAVELLERLGAVRDSRVQLVERPDALRGDEVSMNKVLAVDLEAFPSDCYLMTHATNPFVTPKTLIGALTHYQEAVASKSADSLFSVNKHQTRFYSSQVKAINHDPTMLVQTQDLEPWYEENSCIYIFSKQSFSAAGGARIGQRPTMFEMSRLESIDIDTPDDWAMAELVAGSVKRSEHD
jgi:CMP-N-acetylneuraminic acid synthetase